MKKILFVDDDPHILQGLRRMLHPLRHEWEMVFVDSGENALRLMAESPFDVIVSDMRMPGMDGAHLLGEVKNRFPQTVRIILSGYSDQETILKTVRPAHQYLSKPCDAETLKTAVARAFALRGLLSDSTLARMISSMESLPSLPSMYAEILAELQSPEASVAHIAEIVSKDVGMTAKILQIVNSAFFGLSRRVTNPAQAVTLLGLDTIKGLALTLQIFERFDQRRFPGFPIEQLWDHSLAVAASARRIAQKESPGDKMADDAFLAGLLHDVGKLVLVENFPAPYIRALTMAKKKRISESEAEKATLGATHAEVGAYLLALWGLPDPIVEGVAFHHYPEKCPNQAFSPLAAVCAAHAELAPDQPEAPAKAGPEAKPFLFPEMETETPAAAPPETAAAPPDKPPQKPQNIAVGLAGKNQKMTDNILCVDDDPNILVGYQRALRKHFEIDTALGPLDGIEKFSRYGPYAVVVSDMRMPEMDGVEFLAKIREINGDTVRIMLTGHAELRVAMEAINRGNIFRFLMKPCHPSDLAAALEAGIEQYRLITAERELLDKTLTASIQALVDLLAIVDTEGFGKSLALRDFVRGLAQKLKIENYWSLEVAAMLLPIGNTTLPPEILLKKRAGVPLSEQEEKLARKAPEIGHNLLKNIPRLEPVAQAVLYQAKNYDGSGFPEDAVSEKSIPLGARILRVLKDFHEERTTGKPAGEIFDQLSARTGFYDPLILASMRAYFEEMERGLIADSLKTLPTAIVYIRDLAPGQVLARDVYTLEDRLLISAGYRITEAILAKIHNYHDFVGVAEPLRILK